MDGYEQGELRLSAGRYLHVRPYRRHRTVQIGPACIGRTIAALMLRLFTRREHYCLRGAGHPARWCRHLAEHTRERLGYWQYITLRAEHMDEPHEIEEGTGEWYGQLARATDPNRDLNLLRRDF